MPHRLTAAADWLSASCINSAGAPATRLDTDNSGTANDFTFIGWWYCEEPNAGGVERGLFEYTNGTSLVHSLTVESHASGYKFRWYAGAAKTAVLATPLLVAANLYGTPVEIFASFLKNGTFANSTAQIIVRDVNGNLYSSSADTGITSITTLAPDGVVLGARRGLGTSNSAKGIFTLLVRNDAVRDTPTINAIAAYQSPVAAAIYDYSKIILGINQANGWKIFGSSSDGRIGKSPAGSNLGIIDAGNASFAGYFGRNAVQTVTSNGSPVIVNPYTYSGQPYWRAERNPGAEVSPASTTFLEQPFGSVGPKLAKLCDLWRGGGVIGQIRLIITANSRNGYNSYSDIRLRSGSYVGVNAHDGYNEGGMYSQTNFWPNIVGHINAAPPTGFATINNTHSLVGSPFDNGDLSGLEVTQAPEETFGFRTNATTGYPLCRDNADAASTMILATYPTTDTSISRFWVNSRPSGIGASSPYFFTGAGAPRGIKAGYSYRLMCSPEHTMPTTEGLEIGIVFLNCPSSSGLQYVIKETTASTQDGANTGSFAVESLIPNLGSFMTPITITATTGTRNGGSYDTLGEYSSGRVTLTVNDTTNPMSAYAAGDIVELLQSTGVPYGSPARPAISCIYSITGKGTSTCVVTLDRPFFRDITAASDKIQCIEAANFVKTLNVTFAAGEAAAGEWRGVKIKASNDGKSGVVVAAFSCRNTTRAGLLTGNYGWPGVGYTQQYARQPKIVCSDGKTHMQRVIEWINPDVVLIAQANQGIASGAWVSNYTAWYNAFHTYAPNADIAFAQGGPEETTPNGTWTAAAAVADSHCAMQTVAQANGVPMVSWFFSPRGCHHLLRYLTSDDAAADITHPTCAVEGEIWFSQLCNLTSSSFRNRVRAGRYRNRA